MNETALTRGIHHVGLTVPDLQETLHFFLEVLGYRKVGEKPDYPAAFVSDGVVMITLWQAKDPARAQPFDRANHIGLHHLALAVQSHAALDALHERLRSANGVEIEFPPEPLGTGGARHLMCAIPGGIRVEFTAAS